MSIEEFLKDRRFIIQIFTDVGVKPEYLNYLNDIIDDLSKLPENMDLYEDDPTRTKGQILVQIAFMLDQKIISAMDAAAASAAAAAAETMASTRTAARAARAADEYDLVWTVVEDARFAVVCVRDGRDVGNITFRV